MMPPPEPNDDEIASVYTSEEDIDKILGKRFSEAEQDAVHKMMKLYGKNVITEAMAEMGLDIRFFLNQYKGIAKNTKQHPTVRMAALDKIAEIRNYVLDLRQTPTTKKRIPKDEKIIRDLPKDVREEAEAGEEWESS